MEEFVLQPQSEISKVRQFVREIGYHIEKENMILELLQAHVPKLRIARICNVDRGPLSRFISARIDVKKRPI